MEAQRKLLFVYLRIWNSTFLRVCNGNTKLTYTLTFTVKLVIFLETTTTYTHTRIHIYRELYICIYIYKTVLCKCKPTIKTRHYDNK